MKLKLTSRKVKDLKFVETEILGAKVTLSKALVEHLKEKGLLTAEAVLETTDDMVLIASAKEGKNGKPWANLYLTLKKREEIPAPGDDDLPF